MLKSVKTEISGLESSSQDILAIFYFCYGVNLFVRTDFREHPGCRQMRNLSESQKTF